MAYLREHIRRFGKYDLDMDVLSEALSPRPIPFETLSEVPYDRFLHVS